MNTILQQLYNGEICLAEQYETASLDFFQMFSDGFKPGAKMMIEVLYSGDEKATDE